MNVQELIKQNNEKREQLTEENEMYYTDIVVYIRSHLTLSEQKTEELLIELLDHLFYAQLQGKSAKEVFGNDPKGYCDELIKHLPKESKKNAIIFTGFIFLQLLGWMAIGRGSVDIIFGLFMEIDNSFYLGSSLLITAFTITMLFATLLLFFFWIRSSIYKKTSKPKNFLIGFLIALVMTGSLVLMSFIPTFGYAITINGYIFLIVGIILIVLSKWMERINKKVY
ncbi:DUF1129 family protein [Salirhabdus euzebyi]|nr:DUF1129 family protein [Salirhabdus euzebyi]